MNTTMGGGAAPRPNPGWASAAGLVDITSPEGSHGRDSDSVAGRLLITERIARYGWAYDERDQAALAECFTANAVWRGSVMGEIDLGTIHGAANIARREAGLWAKQGDQRRHVFSNHLIELSGSEATAHAYMVQMCLRDAAIRVVNSGAYRFHLCREAAGLWRIDDLTCALDNLISA